MGKQEIKPWTNGESCAKTTTKNDYLLRTASHKRQGMKPEGVKGK